MTLFAAMPGPGAGSTRARWRTPTCRRRREAYQFDWSHEIVVMNGVTTIVKVAHVRLCHSGPGGPEGAR